MKVSPPSKSDRSIPSFVVIRCALILFVGMIMPVSLSSSKAQGATLEDYRSRIHQSVAALDAVSTMDEDESDEAYKARIDDTLRTVKGLIPSNETVKAGESEMPVDNAWFGKSIAALNAEKTIEGRQAVLDYMTQRLSAIELQLGESASDSTNNEENKARMAALLRRSEFAEKTEKESTLARLIRRANEWLRRLFGKAAPVDSGTVTKASRAAQFVIYGIIFAAILFILWKLLPFFKVRSRRIGLNLKRDRVVLGEKLSADTTPADLLNEAENLARTGDLRGAIRKGYIAFLCELSDRQLIRLEQNRTNRDYLRSVKDREPLFHDMQFLTHSFERHWYGLYPATEADWGSFRSTYAGAFQVDASHSDKNLLNRKDAV